MEKPPEARFAGTAGVSFLVGVMALLWTFGLIADDNSIWRGATSEAQRRTGHVVPVWTHGRFVYVTSSQYQRLEGLHWSKVAWVVLVIGAGVLRVRKL
jgi:hypothetical protein